MGFFPVTNYDFPNVSNYDSDLRELLAMYGQLVKEYTSLVNGLDDLRSKYEEIERKYTAITRLYEQISAKMNALDSYTRGMLTNYGNALDAMREQIEIIQTQISDLNRDLFAEIAAVRQYSDTKDAEVLRTLRAELSADVADLQAQIDALEFIIPPVFNPARGIVTELSTLISDWWYWLRYGGYTAAEWDADGFTAGAADALGHSAIEWDVNGKIYIYGGI